MERRSVRALFVTFLYFNRLKQMRISLLFILWSSSLFSQTISGVIIDSETKKPIPYVNVGILHKNTGTVSDHNGVFKLPSTTRNPDDTLKISCVGYAAFVLPLHTLNEDLYLENQTFELDASLEKLKPVEIRPGKIKTDIVGNRIRSGTVVVGFSTNDLGTEVGTVLKYRHKQQGQITNLNFCLNGTLFDSIFVRVNIYEFKDGAPGKSILSEPIYLHSKSKGGNLSIDVSDKNIFITSDCFLSVEWIDFAGDFPEKEKDYCKIWFNAAFLRADSFLRTTSQSDWVRKDFGVGFWATVKYRK
ncbi:MAG: carboxypeptidase-like regulatory domain-containing protein [Bacteroidia bacterium]|jgi:hypothetical protein